MWYEIEAQTIIKYLNGSYTKKKQISLYLLFIQTSDTGFGVFTESPLQASFKIVNDPNVGTDSFSSLLQEQSRGAGNGAHNIFFTLNNNPQVRGGQMDSQIDRQIENQTYRQRYIYTNLQTDRLTDR